MSRPTARAGGFTLLEVIVVMALLSLIMLAMGSALRTTAQTEQRIDTRLARTDELRVSSDFLRSVLGRVSAQQGAARLEPGASRYAFAGGPQEMRWLGVMPARHGVGGRHHFRLAIEPQGLVLRYLPWQGEQQPDWGRSESYVLVAGATALALRFEDTREQPSQWVEQWAAPDALPQRVALAVQTAQGAWPDLVVNMRRLPGTDPDIGGGGAVFGGSR
ncbi:prepilin-type N-terminal cleavage/methylation domain-containing protein [Pseudorhodoferax sp.]|uniref:prepilin-type N-terminal cleavage/methylation domain-containing protein n=1 Tax=Pseudorhodoferax sp. TaxID=1993553 RepID=UPI002DD625BA|nr:prepilin-type N-terminal cleavage/methylation domain-containing protein [Pseudorhodoferax sp.]